MRLSLVTLLLVIFLTGLCAHSVRADDEAPLAIEINTEPRGTLVALLEPEGDILLLLEDLEALGLNAPGGLTKTINNQDYISLSDIEGLTFHLNMATLTLELTADPNLLKRTDYNLDTLAEKNILRPEPDSAFLNYSLGVGSGTDSADNNLLLTSELGIRRGRYLFMTNGQMIDDNVENSFVRLNTSLIHEQPDNYNRLIVGDIFSTTDEETGGLQLGGVQFSSNFRIDPYFKTHPGLNLSGTVDVPTEIEVLLDGHRVLKEQLPPGPYNLNNIRRFRGAGEVEIILRDAYGREERILQPFYLSDDLLKERLHSFSYSLGVKRELFGRESFNYGDAAFQAFHDYGWNEKLTFGAAAEGGTGLISLIPRAVWQPGNWGRLRGSLGMSTGSDGLGYTGSVGYQYYGRSKGFQLEFRYANDSFATLANIDSNERPEFTLIANTNLHSSKLGSLTLDAVMQTDYLREGQNRIGAIYSKRLGRSLSMVASLHAITGRDEEERAFISFNYQFNPEITISAIAEMTSTGNNFDLQVEKLRPIGKGYSYKALLRQASDDEKGASTLFNPSFEYRGRNGIYNGEIWTEAGGNSALRYRAQASGAITYLGGQFGFTRPVTDSFALVQVADLEGIPVLLNSQEIGRTDAGGSLFVAEMKSYYKNQISIDDRQVPITRALETTQHLIAPPLRSGFCLYFAAPEIQPLIGRLAARDGEGLRPLEFTEFELTTATGQTLTIPTGKGGEFYYDPAEIKRRATARSSATDCGRIKQTVTTERTTVALHGSILYNGQTVAFEIPVPDSDDFFADAGRIIINSKPVEGEE